MRYLLIVLLLIGCTSKKSNLPSECQAEKRDLVIDKFTKDTVLVESRWLHGLTGPPTGDIVVKNKFGNKYTLECGEYKITGNSIGFNKIDK